MTRFPRAIRIAVAILFANTCWSAHAQQTARPLPQAAPAAIYTIQLAIPPGLGYPFAKCSLIAQPPAKSPDWLTCDSKNLQLTGRAPSAPGDYSFTLQIADASGNCLALPVSLRVAAGPMVVRWEDAQSGSDEPQSCDPPPPGAADGATQAAPAVSAVPAPAPATKPTRPAKPHPAGKRVAVTPTAVKTDTAYAVNSPGTAGDTGTGSAADLRAAAGALHNTAPRMRIGSHTPSAAPAPTASPDGAAAEGEKPALDAVVPDSGGPPSQPSSAKALPLATKGLAYSVLLQIDPPKDITLDKTKLSYQLKQGSSWPAGLDLKKDANGNVTLDKNNNPTLQGTPGQATSPPLTFTVEALMSGVPKMTAAFSLEVDDPPTETGSAKANGSLGAAVPVKNDLVIGESYEEKLIANPQGCVDSKISKTTAELATWNLEFAQEKGDGVLRSKAGSKVGDAGVLPKALEFSITCRPSVAAPFSAPVFFSITVEASPLTVAETGTIISGKPIILAPLTDGAVSISVSAPQGTYLSFYSIPAKEPALSCDDGVKDENALLLQLKKSAKDATPITAFQATADSVQTVLPQQPLLAGTLLCAVETPDANPPDLAAGEYLASTLPVTVQDGLNWGRVRAYFVGGALISNNQNSFSSSSANQFLDLNADKFWVIPECATVLNSDGDCDEKPQFHRWPGISTYFDTRLTAIPVAVKSATSNSGGTTTTASADNSLTTQKTARVQVGAYFPFIMANWSYNNSGNALYVAPIAKVGFDTLTGTTNPTGTVATSSAAGSSTTTVQADLDRVYNFYSFGARIGHFGLYPTKSKSPELQSYFDVSFGPYSNLESFVCENSSKGYPVPIAAPVPPSTVGLPTVPTLCRADQKNFKYHGTMIALPNESLQRVWRLDLEGLLKIPSTPLVLGFNANIGQRSVGGDNLDTLRAPADDVRFLFGTKFDIACVMRKLGVGQSGTSATESGSCF